MSNTVLSYDVTYEGKNTFEELYSELDKLNPSGEPARMVLDALLGKPQHWAHGVMDYVLVFDPDTQIFTLILNNLVA